MTRRDLAALVGWAVLGAALAAPLGVAVAQVPLSMPAPTPTPVGPPIDGWAQIVTVLVSLLGGGTFLRWLAARHLKSLDDMVGEHKAVTSSLREIVTELQTQRNRADERHEDVIGRLESLRDELGVRDRLDRIEAATRSLHVAPGHPAPEGPPPSVRGAGRRGA